MSCITVSVTTQEYKSLVFISHCLAREDVVRVKKLVASSRRKRLLQMPDGPAPSQRSENSLQAVRGSIVNFAGRSNILIKLINFAETTDICRHVVSVFRPLTPRSEEHTSELQSPC